MVSINVYIGHDLQKQYGFKDFSIELPEQLLQDATEDAGSVTKVCMFSCSHT
jgi:hypothetical protein